MKPHNLQKKYKNKFYKPSAYLFGRQRIKCCQKIFQTLVQLIDKEIF